MWATLPSTEAALVADGLVPEVNFTPAGARDGTDLFAHDCARFGVAYVSERPSHPGAEHQVPGCGCRPRHEPAVIDFERARTGLGGSTPGEVCLACSDPARGRWVPASFCPQARALMDEPSYGYWEAGDLP